MGQFQTKKITVYKPFHRNFQKVMKRKFRQGQILPITYQLKHTNAMGLLIEKQNKEQPEINTKIAKQEKGNTAK